MPSQSQVAVDANVQTHGLDEVRLVSHKMPSARPSFRPVAAISLAACATVCTACHVSEGAGVSRPFGSTFYRQSGSDTGSCRPGTKDLRECYRRSGHADGVLR
jgi:hypothetical protein